MNKEKTSETKEYKIPVLGSLGLLALGDIGLKVWREKRDSPEGKKELEAIDKHNKKDSE